MPQKKTIRSFLGKVLFFALIVGLLWLKYQEEQDKKPTPSPVVKSKVLTPSLRDFSFSPSSGYTLLKGCKLVENRRNDGDSFFVQTPEGMREYRLYFMDCAESAAKTYRNGQNNFARLAEQGRYFDGLNQEQTVAIGQEAKVFVKKILKQRPFVICTKGEAVYHSDRQYAFVIVHWQDKEVYLHELLAAYGLARVHTKPASLPDQTSSSAQKQQLKTLEHWAKAHHLGAWK